MEKPNGFPARVAYFLEKEIWKPEHLRNHSPRGICFAVLRVVSISWTVFNETKAASRAAALSYSSLLGLGPLIAIAMLVAGFVLDSHDPDLAVNTLNRLIHFVAPQVAEYESMDQLYDVAPGTGGAAATNSAQVAKVEVNPELVTFINNIIKGSKSVSAGALGVFSLIFVVLMLFTSVENAFNEIWGVRRGRSWLTRVVLYWTIVTLGALLFFTSITALGAGTFISISGDFITRLPYGTHLIGIFRWVLPLGSIISVVLVLTLFYRFVPNTHVFWRAALAGAAVVTTLIFLNNLLAFTYFNRVMQQKSLYGSVAIMVILMLGLYIFWIFVLIGGQVSYAVQNVHFRNSQAAWTRLAETMRERLSLIVLLSVSRRFKNCQEPYTSSELGDLLRVPTQIVNECINRLADMQLLMPVPPKVGASANDYRYLPSRPLERITLQQFKQLDDNYGDDPTGDYLCKLDPIMKRYNEELERAISADFFTTSLDKLIEELHLETSIPAPNGGKPPA